MSFIVEGITKEGYTLCGTETNIIIRDLKTLNGVINRIKSYPLKSWQYKGVSSIKISAYTNIFDKTTYYNVYENDLEYFIK